MQSQTEEIKSKLDIVELISEYVPLKQSGANFKGLCPFHNEKTPSFMVSKERQFFKCFGCGEGGDIFTFLQKIENIEFPEALKILAEKAGVQLRHQSYNPQLQNQKTRLYDIHQQAAEFFQNQLFNSPQAKSARKYLFQQRKLSEKTIKDFLIGYAPESWDALSKYLKSAGFSDAEIKLSGLVKEKSGGYTQGLNYYDRFRDRITFPIQDHHGNIVGFTARAMKTDEPARLDSSDKARQAKYINTPQTIIYNKSAVLYGLYKAKQSIKEKDFVILVEGNMDVIACHQADTQNVVASSGTSLTSEQINILKRYTKNLVMAFDADNAGIQAAQRGIEIALQNGMDVKVTTLPQGVKDPDELIQKNPEQWKKVIKNRKNFMEYIIQVNCADKNLDDIDVKRKVASRVLPWINKLIDPITRDYFLKQLSEKIDIAENTLHEALDKIKPLKSYKTLESAKKPISQQFNKHHLVSQRLLALAFENIDYFKELIDKIQPELLNPHYQEIYKQAIIYYTKDKAKQFKSDAFYQYLKAEKEQLTFIFDSLKLLAESEFLNLSKVDLNCEFDQAVKYLKKDHISKKLRQLEKQIQTAEQSGNRSQADELMKEFSELSRELAGL